MSVPSILDRKNLDSQNVQVVDFLRNDAIIFILLARFWVSFPDQPAMNTTPFPLIIFFFKV